MRLVSAAVVVGLLAACATVANARTSIKFSPEGDLESVEVQNTMEEDLERIQSVLGEFEKENGDCGCSGLTCQCCQRIRVKQIRLDENCCLKLTFRPSDGTVTVALTIGGRTVWKADFPVGRPPSTCVDLPFIFLKPRLCIELYNFRIESRVLSGCSRITFKVFGKDIAKVNLGCFRIKFVDLPDASSVDFSQLVRAMKMGGNGEETEMTEMEEGRITEQTDDLQRIL